MSQPPIIQYDQYFDVKILEPVTLGLRDVFQTSRSEVIVMPARDAPRWSPRVSLIEPGDPVVVVVAGVFGSLMREIMTRAGAEVTEFAVEWGQPIDLAKLDKAIERARPKAVTLVHTRPPPAPRTRRRGGPAGQAARRAVHAGQRVLARRPRRAHG